MDKYWSLVDGEMDKFFSLYPESLGFELGKYYKYTLCRDIKHVLFTLSRYKFVSKLMAYKDTLRVLELGCNEALGSILLQQNNNLKEYVGVDFDARAIEWNKKYLPNEFQFILADMFERREIKKDYFNLIFSLDVIEHIEQKKEDAFFEILTQNLSDGGTAIVGTPSKNISVYASECNKEAHINLYDQQRLYELAYKYFKTVFIFNMNDEIVNTGFAPMSCYIFAVCCDKR